MGSGPDVAPAGVDPAPSAPVPTPGRRAPRWLSGRRRAMELLIVFVGVYSAFLLNRLDSDRRDARRRSQILAALEHETQVGVADLDEAISQNEPLLAGFERRRAAGEMPGLAISMNSSSYSATDDATLLQAGGIDLLDVRTLELLRTVNAMQRANAEARRNQFELSLAELANREPTDFYDQATHQLKKRYEWWPYVQHRSIEDAKALRGAEKELLDHLRAQRGGVSPAPGTATPGSP